MQTLTATSLSLLLCLGFSADALADGHSGHSRHNRQASQMQQRQPAYRVAPPGMPAQRSRAAPVVVTRYAPQYRVVIGAPRVVYQQVIVYPAPVYDYGAPQVVYESAPPPVIIQQMPPQPLPPEQPAENVQSGLSAAQVVGAVAGGVIGSRFGGGNGRLVTTAVGAVLGSVVGGELAR